MECPLGVLSACALIAASGCDTNHTLTIELFNTGAFVDGDTENASFLAVQDGNGAWTGLDGDHGVYSVPLMSNRYGVAIGCSTTTRSTTTILQRTAADGLDVRSRSCHTSTIELDVTVHNLPASSAAFVSAHGTTSATRINDGTVVLHPDPGPTDVFVVLASAVDLPTKVVRLPTRDLQSQQAVAVDFATQGAAFEEHPLAVTLAAGETALVGTTVTGPTGSYLLQNEFRLIAAPSTFQILPADLRHPDDLFDVFVTAVGSPSGSPARKTKITMKAPAAVTTFDLPPTLAEPVPTLSTLPFLHPVFSFANTASNLRLSSYAMTATTTRSSDSVSRQWSVTLSASWVANQASIQFAFPDLSAVPGFSADFVLLDAVPISWQLTRTDDNSVIGNGHIVRDAFQRGTVGP